MNEIRNCPECHGIFQFMGKIDVCPACHIKEEELYSKVYRFLQKKENRSATVAEIVDKTEVDEELLYKWVRTGRLNPRMYPGMGYPCYQCGALTKNGKLCLSCTAKLKMDLKRDESEKAFREEMKKKNHSNAYFSNRDRWRKNK